MIRTLSDIEFGVIWGEIFSPGVTKQTIFYQLVLSCEMSCCQRLNARSFEIKLGYMHISIFIYIYILPHRQLHRCIYCRHVYLLYVNVSDRMCASYQLKSGEVAHNSHARPGQRRPQAPVRPAANFFPQPKIQGP